jgi:hypothetical protein
MVHDFSLAEDLMQETFVRLHRKIGPVVKMMVPNLGEMKDEKHSQNGQ